jgi:hypothetical protein
MYIKREKESESARRALKRENQDQGKSHDLRRIQERLKRNDARERNTQTQTRERHTEREREKGGGGV